MPAKKPGGAGDKSNRQGGSECTHAGLFAQGGSGLPISCKSKQWERVPVIGIGQIEHSRKSRPSAVILIPRTVRAQGTHQIIDTVVQTLAADIASRKQRKNRPRCLRRRARIRNKSIVVIAGAAFAPAAIAVLIRADQLNSPLNTRLIFIDTGRSQAAQRQEGAVNIIDAPASVPASVRFLSANQILPRRA